MGACRGVKPLGSSWLWFHLLLWAALVTTEGEECGSWIYGKEDPAGPFPCPGPMDEADAQFCCGTCSAPFCCSSEAARLDQAQCPASQQATKIPVTSQPQADSTVVLPVWAILGIMMLAAILIVPFGYALSYAIQYAHRQLHRCWAYWNLDPADIPQPLRRYQSMSDFFAALAVGPPPYDVVCPHGRTDVPPTTTTGLSAEELERANDGDQGDAAQSVASGQPSPCQACAPTTVQPSSAAAGSLGPRRRRSASVGDAGDNSAVGNDPPSYGSWALASVWALATLRGNPWVQYPARGNRRGLQMDPRDTFPRCSDVASPTPGPEEPPPSYEAAVAEGSALLPCALETLSVVQFRRATSGAAEDEVVLGSPPAVPDAAAAVAAAAAAAAGPI